LNFTGNFGVRKLESSGYRMGDRAFPVAAARAWNSLPSFVRDKQSPAGFRQQLKTVLFRTCFSEDAYA